MPLLKFFAQRFICKSDNRCIPVPKCWIGVIIFSLKQIWFSIWRCTLDLGLGSNEGRWWCHGLPGVVPVMSEMALSLLLSISKTSWWKYGYNSGNICSHLVLITCTEQSLTLVFMLHNAVTFHCQCHSYFWHITFLWMCIKLQK